nr:MAG TPA: hypothetical protein [Caudoviricetes sp.]
MNTYKPEYLGKVIPADDNGKLYEFMGNKYDAFSKIYDACKNYSDAIANIGVTNDDVNSLSVQIVTDEKTISEIVKEAELMNGIKIQGDVIVAEVEKDDSNEVHKRFTERSK